MTTQVGYTETKVSRKALLFPSILFCIYFLTCSISITQFIACNFSYHSSLGDTIYNQYYLPWKWISCIQAYGGAYPEFFTKVWVMVAGSGVGAVVVLMFVMKHKRRASKGNLSLHGTAHFATKKEVETSGLYRQDEGVYVGGYRESPNKPVEYLRLIQMIHVFLFCPSRGGKGLGIILPTLLSWLGSVFVLDTKGENFALTAGWRKLIGQKIIKFQPNCNDGTGSCFNPFEEVRLDTDYAYTDVDNIINIVAAPEDPNSRIDPHFDPLAKTFLVACALHFLHEYKTHGAIFSLPSLNIEISRDDVVVYLKEMVEKRHTEPCVNVARQMLQRFDKVPKEAGSILSTAQRYLRLYNDPIIAKNMSHSDFKIMDLMRHIRPVSFYLLIPPNQIDRFAPLTRMIIDMIIQRHASEMKFAGGEFKKLYKHKLLLMLDELPAFGNIPVFEKSLGFLAGYGIIAYIIAQDKIQLTKAYTEKQTLTTNCHVTIAYPPNEPSTEKAISEMTGQTTVVKKKVTVSGTRLSMSAKNMSVSNDEIKRPLLTPDEVGRMRAPTKDADNKITAPGEILIFQTGQPPIRGEQLLFFTDPVFLERSQVPPPKRGDIFS